MFWYSGTTVYPNAFFAAQGIKSSLSDYEIGIFCRFVRYAMKEGNDKFYHVPESIETRFDIGDDREFFERNRNYIRIQNRISYLGKEMTEREIDDINLCLGFGLPLFAFELARVWFRNWLLDATSQKVPGELELKYE